MYHSGETGDLEFTLNWLREQAPDRQLGAVGVSLGGNALLKFLGTAQGDAQRLIGAAVAISVPFNLSAGANELERLRGKLYSSYLLRKLRSKLQAKRTMMPPSVDMTRALAARTFRQFDGRVTAPLHGFIDAEDYYRQSSSARFLAGIELPTLLIHAADDPFLPESFVPRAAVTGNRQLLGAFPERGGHIGFVTNRGFFNPKFWAEAESARFLASQLVAPPPLRKPEI